MKNNNKNKHLILNDLFIIILVEYLIIYVFLIQIK